MIEGSQASDSADSIDLEAAGGKPDGDGPAADRIVVGIGDGGPDHYRAAWPSPHR